ncbi:MAG: glycosyltransferase family A protein [Ardenticatenales bacterium]
MTTPLVSCVVPCFNGERYLAEAIDSIRAQTHRQLEIIVIDDGSTDRSAEIVRRYGAAVRYHYQENRGPGAACNQGVALATGAFVAFLEQDDLWLPEKTARQLAAFETEPTLDYCVGHIQNFWIPELAEDERRFRDAPIMQSVPGYVVQTLMVRRERFAQLGRFDETLHFSFASDWFLRAGECGAVGTPLADVLTRRRLHHDNFSRRNRAASHDQFLHVVKAALDRRRQRDGTR